MFGTDTLYCTELHSSRRARGAAVATGAVAGAAGAGAAARAAARAAAAWAAWAAAARAVAWDPRLGQPGRRQLKLTLHSFESHGA